MDLYLEFLLRSFIIGTGGTIAMDLWAILLKQFGVKSLNITFLGRWIGYLPKGKWVHESIANSAPIKGELIIGWSAHYLIGIIFAIFLVSIFGLTWARSPSLLPALFIGIVTVFAPYFIMQPGFGVGIASSKTKNPNFNRIKSLGAHTIYGFGMYLSAVAAVWLVPVATV